MVADGALDPQLCHDLSEFVDNNPQLCELGRTSYGVEENVKKTYDCFISEANDFVHEHPHKVEEITSLKARIFQDFSPVVVTYKLLYPELMKYWDAPLDTGYKFQRYLPGQGYFTPHVDGATYHTFPSCERVLGVVMYLNTVEEGGTTRFDLYEQEVAARQGRVLLFPSNFNFVHTGMVPLSGRKDIISTFVLATWNQQDMRQELR